LSKNLIKFNNNIFACSSYGTGFHIRIFVSNVYDWSGSLPALLPIAMFFCVKLKSILYLAILFRSNGNGADMHCNSVYKIS